MHGAGPTVHTAVSRVEGVLATRLLRHQLEHREGSALNQPFAPAVQPASTLQGVGVKYEAPHSATQGCWMARQSSGMECYLAGAILHVCVLGGFGGGLEVYRSLALRPCGVHLSCAPLWDSTWPCLGPRGLGRGFSSLATLRSAWAHAARMTQPQ